MHAQVGTGIADITGPAGQINMMGYANPSQTTLGLQTRLFARGEEAAATTNALPASVTHSPACAPACPRFPPGRAGGPPAFIVVDTQTGDRAEYVNTDLAFVTQMLKLYITRTLRAQFGDLYTERNVALAATHTHGCAPPPPRTHTHTHAHARRAQAGHPDRARGLTDADRTSRCLGLIGAHAGPFSDAATAVVPAATRATRSCR